ncbi:MAG: hypothetical protein ACAH95_05095, partial [Fimbriimonas sp.]
MGIVITAFAALACLQGDGLLGARAVIGKLTATDPEITTTIRELEFLATLDRFARESPAMTPSTAGERWFALIAEGSKVPRRPPANGMPEPPGSLGTVFTVLPRPESWPRISELVEQMPNTRQKGVLQKLFVRLEGDDDKLLRLIAESDASKKSDEFYDPMSKPRLGALRRKGSVEEVLIAIEKSLAEEVNGQLEPVPDLVSIWGESKAAPIYLQLLKIVKGQLQIDGAPSRLLAKTLVLANLSSIKSPQWQFGSSPTDSEYIAKLVKHYGLEALTSAENQQTDALGIHLRALLLKGEVKQVASILKKLKNVPQLESEEYSSISPAMASRLYPSVLRLMTLVPDRDLWELYVRCATCSGHTKEVAARLSKLVRGKEKMTIPRWRLLNYLADIHGAQGDVKAILSDFALAKRLPKTDEFYDISTGKLLPLGVASGDPSLVSKGVAEQLKDPNAQRDAELFRTLMGLKRYAEAESLIVNSIKKDRQTKTPTYANEQGYRLAL